MSDFTNAQIAELATRLYNNHHHAPASGAAVEGPSAPARPTPAAPATAHGHGDDASVGHWPAGEQVPLAALYSAAQRVADAAPAPASGATQ
jgi:hypothetical protein